MDLRFSTLGLIGFLGQKCGVTFVFGGKNETRTGEKIKKYSFREVFFHGSFRALRLPQRKDLCGIPQGHRCFSLWYFLPQALFAISGTFVVFCNLSLW